MRLFGNAASEAPPRVALVTGAAGGLGRAVCPALCDRGMLVTAADLDADGVGELAAALRDTGSNIAGVTLDVTRRADVEALVARLVDELGRFDVLVNLAGVIRNQVLAKIDDTDFDLVLATHLHGTLNTMRAALPAMRANAHGRVVNMSSIAARGSIGGGAYAAAKAAIEGLTRTAAMEYARHGVTVNCVAAGLIDAGMFLTVPDDYRREHTARIPMQRAGTAGEVASCVAFLASVEASYVTGQTLSVCGGLSLGF